MKRHVRTILAVGVLAAMAVVPNAKADSTSYTGTLASSSDVFETTLTLGVASNVSVQTYGFGGGTNAAGKLIAPGGFDPLFGMFSGTGAGATAVTNGSGNPYITSDVLSNYSSSFMGCPPAGGVNVGGAICGDITMSLLLDPGVYTLLLSDAGYIPNAVFDNGTLGEGFTDLTGGAFQTCNGSTCVTDTGNWAFDVTATNTVPTPEPGSLLLLGTGLFALAARSRRNRARNA